MPSIETSSSDVVSPRFDERRNAQGGFSHLQDSYPRRMAEHRMQSPASRSMAVINDDGPPVKRRRMIHEDDSGRFRPLPPRDHSIYVASSDSHLTPTSSTHSGDFLTRRTGVSSSQLTQGLYRGNQPTFIDPDTSERLPVYDAPESGYFSTHPSLLRRADEGALHVQQDENFSMRPMGIAQVPRDNASESLHARRHVIMPNRSEDLRMVERDGRDQKVEPDYHGGTHIPKPLSSEFLVSSNISRPYATSSSTGMPDQDFVHSFSQSRLDPPLSRSRNGFTVLSERQQNFVSEGSLQSHENFSARSHATASSTRARSPVRYAEDPM